MRSTTRTDTTDALVRNQLAMFRSLGDKAGFTSDDQRRALGLAGDCWRDWNRFLANGRRPADPPVPDMLQRLGETAFGISLALECQSVA